MTSTGAARNWGDQINAKQWGKVSFSSQLLLIQAGFNLDQESISCPNGLEPEAKAASGWSARGEGKGRRPEHHTSLLPGEGLADLPDGYSMRSVAAPAPDLSCAEQLAGRWHCVALSVPTQFALYVCQESSSY